MSVVLLCSLAKLLSLPRSLNAQEGVGWGVFNIPRMHLVDCGWTLREKFSFFPHSAERKLQPEKLLWTFDVQISEGWRVLQCCVSPVNFAKTCNQCLFTVEPPTPLSHLHFHNLTHFCLSYQIVIVTWKGLWVVLESVNRWVFSCGRVNVSSLNSRTFAALIISWWSACTEKWTVSL